MPLGAGSPKATFLTRAPDPRHADKALGGISSCFVTKAPADGLIFLMRKTVDTARGGAELSLPTKEDDSPGIIVP